jgi:hypothetical protein
MASKPSLSRGHPAPIRTYVRVYGANGEVPGPCRSSVLPSEFMRRVPDETTSDPLLFVAERARATLNRVVAYLVVYVVCVCVLVLIGFVLLTPPAP